MNLVKRLAGDVRKKYQAIFFVNGHEAFLKVYKALYSLAECL